MIGTPAEEGGNGKEVLMEAGVIKDTDFSMMAHPCPFNTSALPYANCVQSVSIIMLLLIQICLETMNLVSGSVGTNYI